MATTSKTLTSDQIDDLLYCARAGETDDMVAYFDELVEAEGDKAKAKRNIIEQVLDSSENGMLHYTCANGHLESLKLLLPYTRLTTLLHQNNSGNTPLHWAGLNGHLDTVKILVAKIEEAEKADPSEAEKIRAVNKKRDAEARENKKRKEAESQSQSEQEQSATSATTSEDREADRSIWDIRNNFGRGPTSESQLNDQEAVVQFLLTAMGGSSGESEGKAAASATTTTSTEDLAQEAGKLSVGPSEQ